MSKDVFELDTLEQSDCITEKLVHPETGEDLPATITIYGQDSDIAKAASHAVQDACAEYSRRNRGKAIPSDKFAELDRKKLIKVTKSIDGLTKGGKPFTDVAEIFRTYPCFLEQAVAIHTDRTRFIKASSAK